MGGDLVRPIFHRTSRELWCGHTFGRPCVHPSASVQEVGEKRTLLVRTPLGPGFAVLVVLHCASAKANYLLRLVEPLSVAAYARAHDDGRRSISAHWASWADCLPMMFARHPEVASRVAQQLEGHPDSPFLSAASSVRVLSGTIGV